MYKDKDKDKDIKGVWGENQFRDFTKKIQDAEGAIFPASRKRYKPLRLEANNKYPYLGQKTKRVALLPFGWYIVSDRR